MKISPSALERSCSLVLVVEGSARVSVGGSIGELSQLEEDCMFQVSNTEVLRTMRTVEIYKRQSVTYYLPEVLLTEVAVTCKVFFFNSLDFI